MGVTMWVYDSIGIVFSSLFLSSDVVFLYCRECVEDGCRYVAVGVCFCLSVCVQFTFLAWCSVCVSICPDVGVCLFVCTVSLILCVFSGYAYLSFDCFSRRAEYFPCGVGRRIRLQQREYTQRGRDDQQRSICHCVLVVLSQCQNF